MQKQEIPISVRSTTKQMCYNIWEPTSVAASKDSSHYRMHRLYYRLILIITRFHCNSFSQNTTNNKHTPHFNKHLPFPRLQSWLWQEYFDVLSPFEAGRAHHPCTWQHPVHDPRHRSEEIRSTWFQSYSHHWIQTQTERRHLH